MLSSRSRRRDAGVTVRFAILVGLALAATSLAGAQATASLDEDVLVDGRSSAVEFAFIASLIPAADGGVIAVEARDARLRRFDASGLEVGVFGRRGSGPGEFRTIAAAGSIGDTLWITDLGTRRTTWMLDSGTLLQSVQWDSNGEGARSGRNVVRGYFNSELAWGEPSAPPGSLADAEGPQSYYLLDARGQRRLHALVTVPTAHSRYAFVDGPTIHFGRQPFADAPILLGGGAASLLYVVRRGVGDDDPVGQFSVTALRSTADTVWELRQRYQPRPLPAAFRDSVVQQVLSGLRSAGASESAVRAALFLPGTRPPISDAFVAHEGHLWLRREDDGADVRYQRVSAQGVIDLDLTVERSVRLMAARGSWVWGLRLDEDGVPSLLRFTLSGRS